MGARINLFFAWFLIPQTLLMGWVAVCGRMLLEILGLSTTEGDIPGRLVGSLLLFGAVYLVLYFRQSLPPEGNPAGKGYKTGQRLVLAANLLGGLFVVFQYTFPLIADANVHLLLDGFTNAFGYWAMAVWVVGFSFLYQSALPAQQA
ncbi:MAG: hypothetical protein PHH47_06865 [Gallionella sp.]|nr:hypothetical protein [Gallionella sp.]MDD4946915.1 hypothetical protein [Gallionella sp.]